MALAMVWIVFAQSLALHGPAQALIQREEIDGRHLDAAFWITLLGSSVLAACFAAVAPLWASVNGTPELATVCWALTPAIILNSVVVVPDAILRRNLEFKKFSPRVLIASVVSGIVGVASAVAGYGVWALVVQQMTLTVLSAIAVWGAVPWRPRLSPIWAAFRDLRSYSLQSTSGILAHFLATRMDALLLGAFFGPVAIGLYRFVTRITDTISDVALGGLGQISLPHLSRFSSERVTFAQRLSRIIHFGAVLTFPAFGVLAPAAPWLLSWIGPQWVDASAGFQVLCLGAAVTALGSTVLSVSLQASGRPGINAAMLWAMAGVTACGMWLVGRDLSTASPGRQVLAIALTFCAIHVVMIVVGTLILFRRILRVRMAPALRPAVPAAVAGSLAALSGWLIQPIIAGASPFGGLVMTLLVAGAAAGLVLIIADVEVSSRLRRLLGFGRVRGRHRVADNSGQPSVASQMEDGVEVRPV